MLILRDKKEMKFHISLHTTSCVAPFSGILMLEPFFNNTKIFVP